MSKYIFVVITLVLVILAPIQQCQQILSNDKLNIDVLYESLCPDSLNFITQQLHPVWKEIAPYVNLKLVPFGKSASLENGRAFVCQHGPKECEGNRIQSCVFESLPDQEAQVQFVNCFMRNFRRTKISLEQGQQCSDIPGFDFSEVSDCYESAEGTRLQLIAEQQTATVSPRFVPTIIYNKQFDQQLQEASLVDFRGVVCRFITQNNPEACRSPSVLRL